MHEAGIADRILDIVVARAHEAGAPRITAIYLEAGLLAGVSEEALRFHWEQHAAGTPAEGAVLHLVQLDEPTDLRLVSIEVEEAVADEGATDGGASDRVSPA
ncbi:MAG: hydrogenase maturation nickel metallochaperone HypA [Chloroflexi bacterium]|jgi:Zn finger protein HypA/HybF involved in hydrogenase expression|nr:hydrogenase maturation nickel metallochaperone HypA [Chloroflexota bacterium]